MSRRSRQDHTAIFSTQSSFEPVHRLIVLAKGSIEGSVFALVLLSIRMLNQQTLGEEPVTEGILCNSPLSLGCCWPGRLQGIFPVGRDLCRRGGRFPVYFGSDRRRRLMRFLCLVSVVVDRRCARSNSFLNCFCLPCLHLLRLIDSFWLIVAH